MSDELIEQRDVDRRLVLVEWATAVFAIFWSVWWAFLMDKILKSSIYYVSLFGTPIVGRGLVLTVIAGYVGLFSYSFVKWMWFLRLVRPRMMLQEFWPGIRPLIPIVAGFFYLVHCLILSFGIDITQFYYGLVLTLVWIIVTFAVAITSGRMQ